MLHQSIDQLAAELGLKRASEIPGPALPDHKLRRSPNYIKAEKELAFVAVIIIGPKRWLPLPGDNRGSWPVKVGTTKDPDHYVKCADTGWEEVGTLGLVWTLGQGWADRLQSVAMTAIGALDDPVRRHIRRGWNHLDPEITGSLLVDLAMAETVYVFDGGEKHSRVLAHLRRGEKAFRFRRPA